MTLKCQFRRRLMVPAPGAPSVDAHFTKRAPRFGRAAPYRAEPRELLVREPAVGDVVRQRPANDAAFARKRTSTSSTIPTAINQEMATATVKCRRR
ncbi:MAG: hypothetical protein HYX76_11690 [Acidobacteria bacterium]|nr:hypothetical protein [Acidobacteriota bacterium]